MTITSKVILPRRVIKQPVPHINPGGDCGPCVLGGVLGYDGATGHTNDKCSSAVAKVLVTYCSSEPASLSHYTMRDALYEAVSREIVEDFIFEPPFWNVDENTAQFGAEAYAVSNQWFKYISMAIRAGYYGLAMVDSSGRRGGKRGSWGTDHWVMICGFRIRSVPIRRLKDHPTMSTATTIKSEILISNSSNSAKDERWIEADQFLRQFGGYNAILVLPTESE